MCVYIYIYTYMYVLFDRLLSTGRLSTPARPVIYQVTTTSRLASQTSQLVSIRAGRWRFFFYTPSA